jgi:hypothetical protein
MMMMADEDDDRITGIVTQTAAMKRTREMSGFGM